MTAAQKLLLWVAIAMAIAVPVMIYFWVQHVPNIDANLAIISLFLFAQICPVFLGVALFIWFRRKSGLYQRPIFKAVLYNFVVSWLFGSLIISGLNNFQANPSEVLMITMAVIGFGSLLWIPYTMLISYVIHRLLLRVLR